MSKLNRHGRLSLFLLAVLLLAGCTRSGNANAARLEALQTDVHPGMPRAQVEQKLQASGLPYGWDAGQYTFLVLARNVRVHNFVHEDRQLITRIGPDAKISNVNLKRIFTGP